MKSLIILLLFPLTLLAGPTAMLVEPFPVEQPTQFKVTVWGLLPEGQAKVFVYKELADMAKMSGVENCAQFDLNRKAVRYWIYFKPSGEVDRADFHMEPPFESKVFNKDLNIQVITKVSVLIDHVETKSDANEVKPTVDLPK